MKKLYKFNPNTGEYIGEVEAEIDEWQTKIAGRPCYKGIANAVWEEPPTKQGYTAYITNYGWELKVNPTLDELKAQKLIELKIIRDTEEVKPIAYNGNLFDYDDKARDRINSAIIALSITGQSVEWATANNTETMVNADDLRGIVANVAVRSNELHVKYRQLKEQVEACATKEQLEKIEW